MTGNPEQLGAADTRLLLEVMKSTAAAALAVSGSTQLETTSASSAEQPGNVAAENKGLVLRVLNSTAEATWRVAETARIGAAVIERAQIATMEGGKRSSWNNRHSAVPIKPEEPLVKIPPIVDGRSALGGGPFVINERVGAITAAAWEGLSEERLKEIDDVLKYTVKEVCGEKDGVSLIAQAVQGNLAAIGLQFATSTYFPTGTRDTAYWRRSRMTELPDLSRVLAMGDYYKAVNTYWYAEDMIRVLQQLMELRGFKN